MDTFTVVAPCLGHSAGAEVQYDPADVQHLLDAGKLVRKSNGSQQAADASLDGIVDTVAGRIYEQVVAKVNDTARSKGRLNLSVPERANAEAKEDKSFGDFLQCLGFAGTTLYGYDVQTKCRGKLEKHYGSKCNPRFGQEYQATVEKGAGGFNQGGAVEKASVQVEGVGALGGFSVPVEYSRELYRVAADKAILMPRVKRYTMTSNQLMVPSLDYSKGATGVSPYLAGMNATWTGENVGFAQQNANMTQIEFRANLLAGYTQASRQLLADNIVAFEQVLTDLFSGAIAFNVDLAIFSGDGIAKPTGYITEASCATFQRGTWTTNGLFLKDLAKADAYLLPEMDSQAIWLMSPSMKTTLYPMSDASGKVVFIPNAYPGPGGPVGLPPTMRIFGKDAFFSQYPASAGTTNDVSAFIPQTYGLALREEVEIGVSEHFAFTTNLLTWRFLFRGDGKSMINSTLTLQNGDTVAPAVAITT